MPRRRALAFSLLACLLHAVALSPLPARAQAPVTLRVGGDTVDVLRDRYGVPHIFARTARGLFYGNGYAVAQDRLGQMELYRRTAKGEMAGLVGKQALAADRETRIDGYTEAEREAQLARLDAEGREALRAYADGVNARIAERRAAGAIWEPAGFPGKLDPAALRPWKETDSIAIGQMMARRFGGDEGGELRNMLILTFLKNAMKGDAWKLFNDALWRNDPASPTTIPPGADGRPWPGTPHWADPTGKRIPPHAPFGGRSGPPRRLPARFDMGAARRAADLLDQTARMALARRYGLMQKWGSYCFAVTAARSATGSAILVGGPQMGLRTPQIAHEVHLSGAGYDCIGMGFAGVPGVLIGHNRHIAWSTTTGVNDQTDVFVETLDPADHTRYRFRGAWRSMEKRVETIAVAGGDPVALDVYRTVHGPVVQWDRAHHIAYSRKASYWDRELDTFAAIARFQRARTVAEFGRACALVSTSHNWFCADQQGSIGFWFTGRTPLRDPRVDPRLPTPGDGTREWRGILPFEKQPHIINPKQGFLANWNNKPAVWWDNFDTPAWGEVFHNGRIAQLLAAKRRVSPEDMRGILLDIGTNDYAAQVMLPMLNAALARRAASLSPAARQAAAYLAAWDHHATEGSVAKTLFDAWIGQVREDLFLKPFGFIRLAGSGLFDLAMQPSLIVHVLSGPRSTVPVQYDYLKGRAPDAVMAAALNRAVARLEEGRGPRMALWTYTRGMVDFAPLPPIPATDRGTYIQRVELTRPVPTGVSILPPGQSEDPSSPHFGDQRELAGWFFFKRMLTDRAAIEADTRPPAPGQ
ncbi:MAG: penicillin acylase family protein [Chthonomonadales bacterium]|nr:penicillin acylase family protein [Chthonomonadales bacterium]